jgi:hypothetical protein
MKRSDNTFSISDLPALWLERTTVFPNIYSAFATGIEAA